MRLTILGFILATLIYAQSNAHFDVISVKPQTKCSDSSGSRFGMRVSPQTLSIACQTVDFLVRLAYLGNGRDPLFSPPRVYTESIQGSPGWLSSQHYAIDAKTGGPQNRETMLGPMMRELLEDRFRLRVHREIHEAPVFELGVGEGGAKLMPAQGGGCAQFDVERPEPPPGMHLCGILIRSLKPGTAPAALYGATVSDLARGLTRLLDRDVIDRTGIAGLFDIQLELSRTDVFPQLSRSANGIEGTSLAAEPQGLTISGAVKKLGLKLTPAKGTKEVLVVDHVERPAEN
jgi:uncharacterized protein (TIGR03435 family)